MHYADVHKSLELRFQQEIYIPWDDPDVLRLAEAEFERQAQIIRTQAHKIWAHLTESPAYTPRNFADVVQSKQHARRREAAPLVHLKRTEK